MMTTSGNAAATLTSMGTRDCVDLKRYRRFPGRTGFDENDYWIWSKKRVTEIGHGSTGKYWFITALGRNIYINASLNEYVLYACPSKDIL